MQKILSRFLSLGIAFSLLFSNALNIGNTIDTVEAADVEIFRKGDYEYQIVEGYSKTKYVGVREYIGENTDIVVPETFDGYPTRSVSLRPKNMEDMQRGEKIQSVVFPKNMIILDAGACMYFSNLSRVTLQEGTECIGTYAFNRCPKLASLTIPASVTYIVDEISDNANLEYCVQKGSYADQYLTSAGKKNITRNGERVAVSDISIEDSKECTKTVDISNPADSKVLYLQAVLIPENASYRRVNWTVSDSDIVMFNENAGMNNYGEKAYFMIKKGGQAVITASSEEGSYTAKCIVNATMDIACHKITLSQDTYEYDGKEKEPTVTVEDLVEGTDYSVEYSDNVEAGTATVTIRGIGANTGSVTKNFTITPKKEAETPQVQSKPTVTPKPAGSGNTSAIKVEKPTRFKVKNISKRKVKLTWKAAKDAKGYEIYRSTKKNGKYKKIKTITKKSTVKYTNSKLKKKKQYFYKIRSYKVVNGQKYYSSFTGVKKIRIKK